MNKSISPKLDRRSACQRLLGLASGIPLAASLLGGTSAARADEDGFLNGLGNTIRVEEDWYVRIGTPDPNSDSPQITSCLSPSWSLWGKYAIFDMNCATQPGFVSGGVQLQLWQNNAIIQTCSNTNWDSLRVVNEEIRYTSAVSIQDGQLVFEILNGSSETWGTFGTGELRLQADTWRNHLNWYSPDFTAENSRIGFASHRVRRFTLERVRYFSQAGLLATDENPRVLHSYDPVS